VTTNQKTPGSLTPALATRIVEHLKKGYPKNTAAALVGISKQLLNYWLDQGAKALEADPFSKDRYARFSLRVEAALAEYQVGLLQKLDQSITDKKVDYRPIKHLLGVRFPKDFQHQPQLAGPQKDEDGAEVIAPEEAVVAMADRLADYLKANPLDPSPPVETKPEEPSGG
jgi:hypothetical protein